MAMDKLYPMQWLSMSLNLEFQSLINVCELIFTLVGPMKFGIVTLLQFPRESNNICDVIVYPNKMCLLVFTFIDKWIGKFMKRKLHT
jgi:hypothetical protein